jgi:hypothetical protein
MNIEQISDIKQLKAMQHAVEVHLKRIEEGKDTKTTDEREEMVLSLVQITLRLIELEGKNH